MTRDFVIDMKNAWTTSRVWLLLLTCCAPLTVGCAESNHPEFLLNMEGRTRPATLDAEQYKAEMTREQTVVDLLTAAFGTPDDPYVLPESGLDLNKIRRAAGPAYSDQKGYQFGLFRKHCVHCHGITGDGAGPTAAFLNPYPRDFRLGVFKFTSTAAGMKPTHADLKRTLVDGLMGTAMPSFALLPDHEVEALVEYVKYLAIRGQSETFINLAIEDESVPTDRAGLSELVSGVATMWTEADGAVIVPGQENLPPFNAADDREAYLASVERGRQLFRDAKTANCIKCHGPNGLGDGGGDDLHDDWNKIKADWKKINTDGRIEDAFALPIQELRPRNLRLGIYRGGQRPVDIYRRIHAGIKGTPMPAAGNVLKPEQIWDVVNYVKQLPYEEKSDPAYGEGHLAGQF